MPGFVVRRLQPGDLAEALLLNNANVPAVNALDAAELARLRGFAVAGLAAVDAHGLVGFCLVYAAGEDYGSLNYRWFSERFTDFAYLDRIAVAHRARRLGVGSALYDGVFDTLAAHPSIGTLCCEVNIRPLNDGSLRFHHRLGFREVGQQETDGGAKTVSLMTLSLMTVGLPRPGPAQLR